jgi:hypothetical protein
MLLPLFQLAKILILFRAQDGSTKNHPVVHQPNTDEKVPVASTSHSLSMSNIKNPGFAKVKGGTVYYLYEAPADAADLKNELKVLETFLGKWNTNVGVSWYSV